jgi:hypothetical protein
MLLPVLRFRRRPAIGDTQSAVIAATAGAALLLGRWLAVRYAGLAPVRRSIALAAGLVPDVLPGPYVTVGATFTVGATVLIECLVAAVSLVGSRPRWSLP